MPYPLSRRVFNRVGRIGHDVGWPQFFLNRVDRFRQFLASVLDIPPDFAGSSSRVVVSRRRVDPVGRAVVLNRFVGAAGNLIRPPTTHLGIAAYARWRVVHFASSLSVSMAWVGMRFVRR